MKRERVAALMMPPSTHWPAAALAGLSCGMRTFAAPAAFAARGRLTGGLRVATLLAAAGELTLDKLPQAGARTDPPALAGRIAAGALSGAAIAGPAGAASGALAAIAGAHAFMHARRLVVDATGLADPLVAVGEDVLAYIAAAVATE
jgi:uncharacterized membrane protein